MLKTTNAKKTYKKGKMRDIFISKNFFESIKKCIWRGIGSKFGISV